MGEEAKRAEPVVDGDHDDAVRHQPAWVVVVAFAADKAASVYPHHDGQCIAVLPRGPEDIQEQAVLRRARTAEYPGRLRAVRREFRGRPHPVPVRGWLRRPPAQRAHRRGSIWHSEVLIRAASLFAADLAVGSADDQSDMPAGRRWRRRGARAGAHRGGEAGCSQRGEYSGSEHCTRYAAEGNSTGAATVGGRMPALLAFGHVATSASRPIGALILTVGATRLCCPG